MKTKYCCYLKIYLSHTSHITFHKVFSAFSVTFSLLDFHSYLNAKQLQHNAFTNYKVNIVCLPQRKEKNFFLDAYAEKYLLTYVRNIIDTNVHIYLQKQNMSVLDCLPSLVSPNLIMYIKTFPQLDLNVTFSNVFLCCCRYKVK